MSLEPYVYPVSPSPQVQLVRDYIQYLSAFNLDKLSGLTTDNFTQQMLPTDLGVAPRTKAEDLAFLQELQAQRNGTPIHVSRARTQCDHSLVLITNALASTPYTSLTTEIARPGPMYSFLKVDRLDTNFSTFRRS
jgi:hypothetical protein